MKAQISTKNMRALYRAHKLAVRVRVSVFHGVDIRTTLKPWIKQIAIRVEHFFSKGSQFFRELIELTQCKSVFICVDTQLHAHAFKRAQIFLTRFFQSGLDIKTPFVVLSFIQISKACICSIQDKFS